MFWRLILGVILNLAASLFAKPPTAPKSSTLDEAGIPRADEGSRIFDFAGTYWRKDPHVAWYGDFASMAITRRTGAFKTKKATIGYYYFLGFMLVLCRQIDALLAIKMNEKPAWSGQLGGGGVGYIENFKLFGGDEREGGYQGNFLLRDGGNSQSIDGYLASQTGGLTPAYRGVVSLVFPRNMIGANSARLPSVKFKLLNISGIHRGWLPEKAVIGVELGGGGASIYIAMDLSGSMFFNGEEATQRAAVAAFLRAIKGQPNISVRIVGFSTYVVDSMERFDCTDADLEDLALFVEDLINPNFESENYTAAFGSAGAFFDADAAIQRTIPSGSLLSEANVTRRKVLIVTGANIPTDPPEDPAAGQAILAAIPNVEVFGFNINNPGVTIHSDFDNTPQDGVPNVPNDDPSALLAALSRSLSGWADMNPAHIIRCLWTDPMRGGIADESEIGDSFETAADLFLAEGFGLSVQFRGADSVEADRLEVERHVDAVSYRSRRTGKIELKPIRNDYVPDDLPVLDSSIVLEWSGLERSNRGELPNQLTVVYTKRENGETASVTRTNVAGVRRAGRVIPGEPVEYLFITRAGVATRACLRDLSVQDRPLLAGTLRLAYLPPELEIGEPFIINEPILGINNVVVRIMESQEGNGRDNSVTVQISEDRFALPAEDTVGDVEPPRPTVERPLVSPYRVVQEAPYYTLLSSFTSAEIADAFTANPDAGFLFATGTKATGSHRDITVGVDAGAGYTDEGIVQFSVTALTLTALTSEADDVYVTIPDNADLTTVRGNSLALIGTELVRIDAFTPLGADIIVTLGRGCLDTVPVAHEAGARIIFVDDALPRETAYTASDTVNVKLLTNIGDETLSLAAATVDTLTFDSRAIRPYPPGRFKLNGSYVQDTVLTGSAVLTWTDRNRLTDITAIPHDHDDAGVTSEVGVTYRVKAEALEFDGSLISTFIDTNVGSLLTYTWDGITPAVPSGAFKVRFSATSVRGGYESWQSPSIDILVGPSTRETEEGEDRLTETGDTRTTED